MTFSFKLLLSVVVVAAVIGSTFRLTMKSSKNAGLRSANNLHRRAQFNATGFQSFSNSGIGSAQIFGVSGGNTPVQISSIGSGSGTSFSTTSLGNITQTIGGSSIGESGVGGTAVYGEIQGASETIGYSGGFGSLSFTPGTTTITPGSIIAGSSGGKKKKSSGGGSTTTPPTVVTTPASQIGSTSGFSGGSSIGAFAGFGNLAVGTTLGSFQGVSFGQTNITGLGSATGGSQAVGGQQGSGYAANGGGFQFANIGNSFSSFFAGLGNN